MLPDGLMLPRERRFWSVLLFLGLVTLARSQYGITNAYAMWSPTHWDNPDTTDLGDINSRASLNYRHDRLVAVALPRHDDPGEVPPLPGLSSLRSPRSRLRVSA